jgi:hypothetical protein
VIFCTTRPITRASSPSGVFAIAENGSVIISQVEPVYQSGRSTGRIKCTRAIRATRHLSSSGVRRPYVEARDVEWASCQPDLPTFLIVDLCARRNPKISLRIECVRVLPMNRIKTGGGVRPADVAMPLQWYAEPLLW